MQITLCKISRSGLKGPRLNMICACRASHEWAGWLGWVGGYCIILNCILEFCVDHRIFSKQFIAPTKMVEIRSTFYIIYIMFLIGNSNNSETKYILHSIQLTSVTIYFSLCLLARESDVLNVNGASIMHRWTLVKGNRVVQFVIEMRPCPNCIKSFRQRR